MSSGHDSSSAVVDGSSGTPTSSIIEQADPARTAQGPDTLSDVLREVRLTGSVFFLVDALTPWVSAAPAATTLLPAVLPRAQHLISYHVIRVGACWCRMPGQADALLEAGDVLVVPHGDAYVLSSDRELEWDWPLDATLTWFRDMAEGRSPFVVTEGGNGPDRLQIVCGFLGCDTLPFNPVLAGLPRLLRVRLAKNESGDRLNKLIDFAVNEAQEKRAGSRCVLLRISELMFVELVRQHLAALPPAHTGWLAALRDPVVGRALALLHQQPRTDWTLDALARHVNSSRSVLSERFTHYVREPPMQYLARWRMHLAAQMLSDARAKISAVAFDVGYHSEASFSRAFKKLVGVSPAAWRAGR
jgi:AraC-like DNA-binding protein